MKIQDDAGAWVDEEFETLDLGDPRRDRRAKELVKRFASRPTASIPGACEGWAESMAAYRFLGNERIDWPDMMQPHWDRTTARMGQLPVELCIADTTQLNFKVLVAAFSRTLESLPLFPSSRLRATFEEDARKRRPVIVVGTSLGL
jgi:hypothetical protein